MSKLPPIELLESTHSFPGKYTFKVIGAVENGLESRVIATVRDELLMDEDPPYTKRTTADGKHLSVTLEVELTNAQEVHQVYIRLMAVPGVVVLL